MAKGQSRKRQAGSTKSRDALTRAAAAERAGDGEAALSALLKGVLDNPDAPELYPPLSRLLADMRFEEASPAVARAVVHALHAPWIDPQPLAPAAISLLLATHGVVDTAAPTIGAVMARDPLLLALLERTMLPSPKLEAMLIAARHELLKLAAEGYTPEGEAVRFAQAMAAQAQLNGWMWAEAESETQALAILEPRLAALPFGYVHIVYALYRPLADVPALADQQIKGHWREAARLLIQEPLEERRMAAKLQSVGGVSEGDGASAAVKAQYEAHPYPRWTTAIRRKAQPIREIAAGLFPHADLPDWPNKRLDVLIAGCGTGKHAADVSTRFQGARIQAFDLSRTSLGYAARMLKSRPGVAFAEADIMQLGDWEQRFDHIESVGVLHHLADPLAGWRILVGLLKPGGSMRVGFYSARGRSRIQAARTALRDAGYNGQTDADLRAARAYAMAQPEGSDARLAADELDFYAASGARDFLFHAEEHELSPAELADMTDALGLSILGLELTHPEAAALYRKQFPDDPAMADLRRWDQVEAEHPDIFRHMCQFWCVKAQ
jgi:SAM-dependent methyltransferase